MNNAVREASEPNVQGSYSEQNSTRYAAGEGQKRLD